MSAPAADVVVVGGGVSGAAISFYLAKAGLRVMVLEASRPGAGASSRGAGIVRAFHHLPEEASLAVLSLATFRDWRAEVGGASGYVPTGFLWLVGDDAVPETARTVAEVTRIGAVAEIITPQTLASLQPHMATKGIAAAVYEPDGGYGDPMLATASLHAAAARFGAELCNDVEGARLRRQGDRIVGVDTAAGYVPAGTVVLAAGPWSAALAADAGVTLPVVPTRMTTGTIRYEPFATAPMTFIDAASDVFFRPSPEAGTAHISIRDARHNSVISPTSAWQDETISDAASVAGITRLTERLPSLKAAPLRAWAGVDGVTPDYRPIYGSAALDGLLLCVGGNFKGFKVAPAVGRCIAELIATGTSSVDLTPFRLDRFASLAAPATPPEYDLSRVA
jgi:glycine/D-amino acid oxidase-like deaminating enzyme